MRDDVTVQANRGGDIAFDVVKIDERVVKTLAAQPRPAFDRRLPRYQPPPQQTIAVGDRVSVIIWEAADNGLFGNSLTELSFPAGAAARLKTRPSPAPQPSQSLLPSLSVSSDMLPMLLGGSLSETSTPPGQASAELLWQAAPVGRPPAGRRSADGRPTGGMPGGMPGGAEIAAPLAGLGAGDQSITGSAKVSDPLRADAIVRLAAQSGRPGTRIPDQQVGSDGGISVPFAGRIEVAGHTPEHVQRLIERRLGKRALDPQVLVVVRNSVANSVSVTGEAVKGTRVPLLPGGQRLLQVIAAAGGGKAPVHDTIVQLSRRGRTEAVPLATLVADPAQDIFAEPGDVLTLVRRPQTFSTFGATGRNAAITFTSDRLSLTEALAKAGGLLDQRADPQAVFLFRYEPVAIVQALGEPIASGAHDGLSPVVYRLDLADAKSYLLARQFAVRDRDIIFIADAKLVPVYHFFRALSKVVGPVETGLLTCYSTKC